MKAKEIYANGDYVVYFSRNRSGYNFYEVVCDPTGEVVADIPGGALSNGEHVARIMCDAIANNSENIAPVTCDVIAARYA